jgi:dihydrofolate synthase / folylpolyglutamate synthase
LIFCKVGTMRGLPTEELEKALPEGMEAVCYGNFHEAMAAARESGEPVLVAGSLFLVGEARAALLGGEFVASAQ